MYYVLRLRWVFGLSAGCCLLGLAALLYTLPAQAQSEGGQSEPVHAEQIQPEQIQSGRPVLKTPWVLTPPLWSYDDDGGKSGFFIELARLIAEEIDHDLVILEYDSLEDMVVAQNSGETDLIAGATGRYLFGEQNLFSDSVGKTRIRVFTRTQEAPADLDMVEGQTIGTLQLSSAPGIMALLDRNTVVSPSSTGQAVIGLLAGQMDAILYPEEVILDWTMRAKIDHLIQPVGQAFNEQERAVILNKARADLMGPINAAIGRLETDGRLTALREKFRMELYDPVPEILRVALPGLDAEQSLAPYVTRGENGEPSGFIIDMFEDLADLAGLEYQIESISLNDMMRGPDQAGVDVVALIASNKANRAKMDLTLPVERAVVVASVLRDADVEINSIQNLVGRRVGVVKNGLAHLEACKVDGIKVVSFDQGKNLLHALMNGQVDALLASKGFVLHQARQQGLEQQVQELGSEIFVAERSVALRFGLGKIREDLNRVIPAYLLSSDFVELREKYFAAPVFWTQARVRMALAGGGAGLFILSIGWVALVLNYRARRQAEALQLETEAARGDAEQAREGADRARQQAVAQAKELRDVSSRLQAVMDAAQSGIVALDGAGRIAIANARARDMLGLEEMTPPFVWPSTVRFLSPQSAMPLPPEQDPWRLVQSGKSLTGETFLMSSSNCKGRRHVQLASSPLPKDASAEIASVLILHDVTDQEVNRQKIERSNRLSAVGQLTGGVAHDFNNLLAIVMGNLELLEGEQDADERARRIHVGLEATRRGRDLTASLLAFAGQARLNPEELDINAVVRDAQVWMSRALPESITVETSLLAGLWPVRLDRTSLESALLNLILNARDAMDGKGRMTLETTNLRLDKAYMDSRNEELPVGRYVMLAVSDTGTGITPAALDHLFEPFFTTKSPGKGSGVGLSMVQGFAKQSGGTVQVYTELEVGTTFKLYFPVSQGAEARVSATASDLPEVVGNKRILLAEDEEDVRDVLATILRAAGYAVRPVPSGDAALELYRSGAEFDLLITDIVMPGELQGTGLAKAIRPLQPDLPMIFLSGYASEATVHGNGLRPEDIRLMKPVPRDELLKAVATALSGQGGKASG